MDLQLESDQPAAVRRETGCLNMNRGSDDLQCSTRAHSSAAGARKARLARLEARKAGTTSEASVLAGRNIMSAASIPEC